MGETTSTQRQLIRLRVNGEELRVDGPLTLVALLRQLKISTSFVAVAYNGEVLRKEEYPGIMLGEGDVLEIVRPVGGG